MDVLMLNDDGWALFSYLSSSDSFPFGFANDLPWCARDTALVQISGIPPPLLVPWTTTCHI
jgi:hypothetical protein